MFMLASRSKIHSFIAYLKILNCLADRKEFITHRLPVLAHLVSFHLYFPEIDRTADHKQIPPPSPSQVKSTETLNSTLFRHANNETDRYIY